MSIETTSVTGRITMFVQEDTFAVLETEFGNAYVDINDALDYRLKVGDLLEIEDAGWYAKDGRIVAVLGYSYRLNGRRHTISDD